MKDSSRTMKILGVVFILFSLGAMFIFGVWGIFTLMKTQNIVSLLVESTLVIGVTGCALICMSGTGFKAKKNFQQESKRVTEVFKKKIQKVA